MCKAYLNFYKKSRILHFLTKPEFRRVEHTSTVLSLLFIDGPCPNKDIWRYISPHISFLLRVLLLLGIEKIFFVLATNCDYKVAPKTWFGILVTWYIIFMQFGPILSNLYFYYGMYAAYVVHLSVWWWWLIMLIVNGTRSKM